MLRPALRPRGLIALWLLLAGSGAQAGPLDDFGAKFGKEAADQIAAAIKQSTDTLGYSVNPIVSLLRDLDSPDAAKSAQARKMLTRMLGRDLQTKADMDYQVRVVASNITPGKTLTVRVVLDENDPSVRLYPNDPQRAHLTPMADTVWKGMNDQFNHATTFTAKSALPGDFYQKTLQEIQADIAGTYAEGARSKIWQDVYKSCGGASIGGNDVINRKCNDSANGALFAASVMKVVDNRIDLRPKQDAATIQWKGERFVTVLVSESDLEANPNATLWLSICEAGHPDQLIPYYADSNKKGTEIRFGTMLNAARYVSNRVEKEGDKKGIIYKAAFNQIMY